MPRTFIRTYDERGRNLHCARGQGNAGESVNATPLAESVGCDITQSGILTHFYPLPNVSVCPRVHRSSFTSTCLLFRPS
jgi:hypothetical protein